MHYRRFRALALAVATIGVAMFGVSRPAAADILVTITDLSNSPVTQYFSSASDTTFIGNFSAGSYTGSFNIISTDYPGVSGQGEISTTIQVGTLTSTTPEDITVQVQIVNSVLASPNQGSSTNALWTSPNGTPVTMNSGSTLSAAGDTGGQVTTTTYYLTTNSGSTTGTGLGATALAATLADGATGTTLSGQANGGKYILSQTVTLSGLVVGSTGTLRPNFGGTSTITGPTIQSVPEPSSMVLAGFGALGLIGFGLRRRKAMGA